MSTLEILTFLFVLYTLNLPEVTIMVIVCALGKLVWLLRLVRVRTVIQCSLSMCAAASTLT